jgi:predicted lactoylglutathione lyase
VIAPAFEGGAQIYEVIGQKKARGISGLETRDFTIGADRVTVMFIVEKKYKEFGTQMKLKAIDNTKMHSKNEEEAKM